MSDQIIHSLLTPDNCAVILIDHQPQMFFGVQSNDRQTIINNVLGVKGSHLNNQQTGENV